jgi:hypothetical protein
MVAVCPFLHSTPIPGSSRHDLSGPDWTFGRLRAGSIPAPGLGSSDARIPEKVAIFRGDRDHECRDSRQRGRSCRPHRNPGHFPEARQAGRAGRFGIRDVLHHRSPGVGPGHRLRAQGRFGDRARDRGRPRRCALRPRRPRRLRRRDPDAPGPDRPGRHGFPGWDSHARPDPRPDSHAGARSRTDPAPTPAPAGEVPPAPNAPTPAPEPAPSSSGSEPASSSAGPSADAAAASGDDRAHAAGVDASGNPLPAATT